MKLIHHIRFSILTDIEYIPFTVNDDFSEVHQLLFVSGNWMKPENII